MCISAGILKVMEIFVVDDSVILRHFLSTDF